ncbi:MAG: helical backbone metal receptor [Bacteroidota bacterium]|nr:helical backbone metal receptor [Bacteroidota bacterium]
MIETVDQTGRIIISEKYPSRIISLVPSITELLYDFGLHQNIVGRTHFCIHPSDKVKDAKRIGGTKTVNLLKVKELMPDLIIANKEENVKEQVEELAKYFPTYISDINTVAEAYTMMLDLGTLTNKREKATSLVNSIKRNFHKIDTLHNETVLYLIWKNPYMSIGCDTFINDMLSKVGYQNVLLYHTRYPKLSIQDIVELNPENVFLSSEPFPFTDIHISELQQILPNSKISLVDGEMFSWYGSRMHHFLNYINLKF